MLSHNKTQFLDDYDTGIDEVYQNRLDFDALHKIANHLNRKLGIPIILNGTTTHGNKIYERELFTRSTLHAKFIDVFKTGIFASSLDFKFLDSFVEEFNLFFLDEQELTSIERLKQPSLGRRYRLKPNLNQSQLEELNVGLMKAINSVDDRRTRIEIKKNFKHILKEAYTQYFENGTLTRAQALEEIATIQATAQTALLGYLFSNQGKLRYCHIDPVLIYEKQLICPIYGYPDHLYLSYGIEAPHFYKIRFISSEDRNIVLNICPQANPIDCATFSLLYLKELLKDNGQQFHDYTLRFSYYDESGKKENVFFPSPHVLRFSHSKTYNNAIRALLNDTDTANICDTYQYWAPFKTLRTLLEESLTHAPESEKSALQNLLSGLPEFRKKWLIEFDKQMDKRELMQSGFSSRNLYATYRRFAWMQRTDSKDTTVQPTTLII